MLKFLSSFAVQFKYEKKRPWCWKLQVDRVVREMLLPNLGSGSCIGRRVDLARDPLLPLPSPQCKQRRGTGWDSAQTAAGVSNLGTCEFASTAECSKLWQHASRIGSRWRRRRSNGANLDAVAKHWTPLQCLLRTLCIPSSAVSGNSAAEQWGHAQPGSSRRDGRFLWWLPQLEGDHGAHLPERMAQAPLLVLPDAIGVAL